MQLILLFCLLFCNFVFAEELKQTANSIKFSSEIELLYGINQESYSKERKPENARVLGEFNIINNEFINENSENKIGLALKINLNTSNSASPLQIKEFNLFTALEGAGGRILGFQQPITSKFIVNTSTFSGVNGGVNGKWQNFITFPFKGENNQETSSFFITKASLPMQNGLGNGAFLQKSNEGVAFQSFEGAGESGIGISYVSNRSENGLRFGITLLANNKNNLEIGKTNESIDLKGYSVNLNKEDYLKNIIGTGFNYYNVFNNIETSFSLLYEHASIESLTREKENLNAYLIGFNIGYLGFMVGGSFANYGSSFKIKNSHIQENQVLGNNVSFQNGNLEDVNYNYVYDVGVGYSLSAYTASFSFLQSRFASNKFRAWGFSFEVNPKKNLYTYFSLMRYMFNPSMQAENQIIQESFANNILTFGIQYKL